MGLKRFLKKAGAWVKDKFHKVKNVVTKFAKPVVRVVKKAVDFVGKTPLGPILNTATGGIFNIVKGVSSLIPDGAVKDNVNKFTQKAEQVRDTAVRKVDELQGKANQVIDKGKQWVDAGQKIGGLIKQQAPKLPGFRALIKPPVQ